MIVLYSQMFNTLLFFSKSQPRVYSNIFLKFRKFQQHRRKAKLFDLYCLFVKQTGTVIQSDSIRAKVFV